LDFARKDNRIVITLDADFHSISAVNNCRTPSVVRFRIEGLKGPDLAEFLIKIIPKVQTQLTSGAMVTVTAKSIRIKNLPTRCVFR
jgi:predicted nuclease of predicted toxin-antitoxin system